MRTWMLMSAAALAWGGLAGTVQADSVATRSNDGAGIEIDGDFDDWTSIVAYDPDGMDPDFAVQGAADWKSVKVADDDTTIYVQIETFSPYGYGAGGSSYRMLIDVDQSAETGVLFRAGADSGFDLAVEDGALGVFDSAGTLGSVVALTSATDGVTLLEIAIPKAALTTGALSRFDFALLSVDGGAPPAFEFYPDVAGDADPRVFTYDLARAVPEPGLGLLLLLAAGAGARARGAARG